jgi:hypothetical protein
MELHTIGIDLGKTVFHLVGLNLLRMRHSLRIALAVGVESRLHSATDSAIVDVCAAHPSTIKLSVKPHCTVKVAEPLTLPEVAVIVVLPDDTPVAKPPPVTVAIVPSLEIHVTELVTTPLVPFE